MDHAVVASYRKPEFDVAGIFPDRWSPRAMKPEPLTREELLPLFEAARWAPSSFNNQPWRFVYALRGTKEFDVLLSLLVEGNRAWARSAGALIVVLSRATFEYNGSPSRTHHFDSGSAWAYFALQGSMRGLAVHGMEGFDYERAKSELGVPEGYDVEAMAAVGHPGNKEDLPKRARDMEMPSGRKRVGEFAFEGRFKQ
jgi:nitroreductase